ncbi:Toxoplasma gondii family A protein [Toxoplasma gondii MAS]|uniref:Toxoplasma gondii family A protein n=2 Tax=Toxoplasma gondii TaxID=5811 RepID=A0A086QIW5_TOXGO|nr:Toxoplasma gondii family A protein [Toxoplasma gondii MAS]PUA85169.1 Toxoplasma gondii family A protein [Toxoplasma gondii TgCATBr9]
MKAVALRGFWLTILLGVFIPRTASKSSGLTSAAPDFTVTIPKEGLPADRQEVFSLRPSGILRVIDETGEAVYMPQATADSDSSSVDPSKETLKASHAVSTQTYGDAYAFVNGKCDFRETIKYKDTFAGYTAPLWVRVTSDASMTPETSSSAVVNYTFTNPPKEYLSEVVSFCVVFKTRLASGSTSSSPAVTKPTESSGAAPQSTSATLSVPAAEQNTSQHYGDSGTGHESVPEGKPDLGKDDKVNKEIHGPKGGPGPTGPVVPLHKEPGQSPDAPGPLTPHDGTASPKRKTEEDNGKSGVAPKQPVPVKPAATKPSTAKYPYASESPSDRAAHPADDDRGYSISGSKYHKQDGDEKSVRDSEVAATGPGEHLHVEQDRRKDDDVAHNAEEEAASEAAGKGGSMVNDEVQGGKLLNDDHPESAETSLQGGHRNILQEEHVDSKDPAEIEKAHTRRLSETVTPESAHLTIVIHSAAWGLAGGRAAIPAFVLSCAAALFSTL